MKLITIYGAPASGKLTIAKKLASVTGFKVFHNHLTFAVADSIFRFDTNEFSALCWDLRIATMEHAARACIPGLIFTWAYSDPEHRPFLERVEAFAREYDVCTGYVRVTCGLEERRHRLASEDRVALKKITSVEHLSQLEATRNYAPMPDRPSVHIDSGALSADRAVQKIVDSFALGSEADES